MFASLSRNGVNTEFAIKKTVAPCRWVKLAIKLIIQRLWCLIFCVSLFYNTNFEQMGLSYQHLSNYARSSKGHVRTHILPMF